MKKPEEDLIHSNAKILKAFESLATRWQLTLEESAQVLGMTIEEYESLLGGRDDTGHCNADQQLIMRVGLLASIHRAVMLFSPNGAYNHFFTQSYALEPLNGMSIRQFLIENNSSDSLERLHRWFNSMVL